MDTLGETMARVEALLKGSDGDLVSVERELLKIRAITPDGQFLSALIACAAIAHLRLRHLNARHTDECRL